MKQRLLPLFLSQHFFCYFLLLSFILTGFFSAQAQTSSGVLLGDLDQDGKATISDIVILVNHITGATVLPENLERVADVNQDGKIDDQDSDFIALAATGAFALPTTPDTPAVFAPETTQKGNIDLVGSAAPGTSIRVEGGAEMVTGQADENGKYSLNVSLLPDRLNRLFITGIDDQGIESSPNSIEVIQDSQAPSLFIDFPEDTSELTNDSIVVAGRVADRLSGFLGLDVKVVNTTVEEIIVGYELGNPQLANVIVGIGTNGTYERGGVPLVLGENILHVEAKDIQGNTSIEEITVTRVELTGRSMIALSGDLQEARVNRQLTNPIAVKVTDPDGNPVVEKIVTFAVTRSNGRLFAAANSDESGKVMLQVRTDQDGEATAWWTMGSDAGCGNNRVAVTSRDIPGTVFFCASANPAPARQVNIGSGNNQRSESGGPALELLQVWVNDTCNGVSNAPVTFTVISGGGKVQGLDTVTVETSITGHANVKFTLGPNQGNNVIAATFPGNPGLPAIFNLVGVKRDSQQMTSLVGLIHNNAMQPIGGAVCTLTIGGGQLLTVLSGADGRFVFSDIASGPAHLHVNGLEANLVNGETIQQGLFPALAYDVVLIPEAENTLPAPVLLPELDPDNAREYDGTEDLVLTIAGVDDLKMIVKAGSMRRVDGSEPTPENPALLSLNQVHFDEIPMPLPDGAAPPFAWTLQPAGVTFDPPIQVVYPNMTGLPEGTITYFLSFDHEVNRFDIVATGHVIEGGFCSVTDPGSGISKAGWGCQCPPYPPTGNQSNTNPECKAKCLPPSADECDDCKREGEGDPVDTSIGEFFDSFEDLRIKGRGFDFFWTRTYRSKVGPNTVQGNGWDFSYNLFIESLQDDLILCDGGGRRDRLQPQSDANWSRNEQFRDLRRNSDGSFSYEFEDTSQWNFCAFDGSPWEGKIMQKVDRNGNTMTFHYDDQGRLSQIIDTLDRDIDIAYNQDGFIASVTDFSGRMVRYEYYQDGEAGGSFGDLKSVTTPPVISTPNGNDFPKGKTTTFTYTTGFDDDNLNHNLLTITDGRRNDPNDPTFGATPYLINEYASSTNTSDFSQYDRIISQVWGGDVIDFVYSEVTPNEANGFAVTKVIFNDRNGNVKEYFYDVRNRAVVERTYTGITDPKQPTTGIENRPQNKFRDDDPEFFETRYVWNNQALQSRIIHPNGNITEFIYDQDIDANTDVRSRGNLRTKRYLPGSHTPIGDQEVIEEHFEYDVDDFNACCGFNFVTKHTDGRGNDTVNEYDERGNRLHTQHRIASIVEDWEYNQFGQMTKHTLPDNGNSHRRIDNYTYYTHEEDDDQEGYLKEEIIDDGNFALTTSYEYDLVGNIINKTDPRGLDTQYVVNELDQVVREISREVAVGSDIRYQKDFFYDANNNRIREDIQNIDDQGELQTNTHFTRTYEYEILNYQIRKTEEVDSNQTIVTEYEYDRNRNRTLTRYGEATNGNQPNNIVEKIYDERDLMFQEIRAPGDADQSTTQYDYDNNQNLVRIHQGLEDNPRIIDSVYDSYNRKVQTIDPMGNTMTYHYDANHNNTSSLVEGEIIDKEGDANNIRLSAMEYVYDEIDRIIREEYAFFATETQDAIDDGLSVRVTEYSDNSQIIRTVNDNDHEVHTTYDTANRRQMLTDAKDNIITYTYDTNNNVITILEVEKSDLGNSDQEFTTTFAYDGLDRTITTVDNVGNTQELSYDSRNNRTVSVDALGNMVRKTYDGINRPTQTTRFLTNNVNASGSRPFPDQPANTTDTITTSKTWDDTTRLIAQTDDNDNATRYAHDALNRRITTTYADGTGAAVTYDVHHNEITKVDANGNAISCSFDLLDREIRRDITPGDNVSDDTTFEVYKYDGLSRLVHAQDDDSLVIRSYNSISKITRETLNGQITLCAYDGVGNKTSCVYPSGRTVTCTYDELERKKIVSDQDGIIATYFYIGPNRVERRDYGNGSRLDVAYDGITGIENPENDFGVRKIIGTTHSLIIDGSLIDDRTFTWDRMGNKVQRADVRDGGMQRVHDYSYDSVYRMISSSKTPDSSETSGTLTKTDYTLDGVGNRTAVNDGNLARITYTMDTTTPEPADFPVNQYTTTPQDSREYDDNGNLTGILPGTGGEKTTLIYDYRNQMVGYDNPRNSIGSQYAYDALGRRIHKTVNDATIRYFYCGWRVNEEQNESNTTQATYVYGLYIDEALNMQRDGNDFYYHCDDLQNITAITDANGTVAERYDYGDYGQPEVFTATDDMISASAIGNPYGFTGRRYDSETTFYYYRTRYMEPNTGRFTTRDTIGIWQDGMNLGNGYTYVGNNAFTLMDAMGKEYCSGNFTPQAPGCDGVPDEFETTCVKKCQGT